MTDRVEGRPLEDVELARLARDGDVQAYGELVERYREVAFRTAWLITRSSAEAEDAAQEAFVKAFYALDRFRAGEAFRPWVLRIVSNEAKNRRRSVGRRERLTVRLAQDRGSGDAAPSPEAAALGREEREALLGAIERPLGAGAAGRHVPLPARALGGRDRPSVGDPTRNREITALARPRATA
jgi:RNA polymerase sigma-70 factor (ECF subfamily)